MGSPSPDRMGASEGTDICMALLRVTWDLSPSTLPHPFPLSSVNSLQADTLGVQPNTEPHSFFRRAEEVLFFDLVNYFFGPRLIDVSDLH